MAGMAKYSSSVQWDGPRATKRVGAGAARGVNLALERLRALAVAITPIDTGALRASATVRPAVDAGITEIHGDLVFDTPYAARQHEDGDLKHTEGRDGTPAGQSHYVSKPLAEHEGELKAIIAKAVRSGLAG